MAPVTSDGEEPTTTTKFFCFLSGLEHRWFYFPRRRKSTKVLYPVRSNMIAVRMIHHTGRFSVAAIQTNRLPVVKPTSGVETPE
ncbi:hypothetical protein EDF54_2519 [Rathayibacter sp. PhB93]|jgi:hypothetical protein|nr:hypothetical protein EDF54_2519 [Rathayibacter sp. PhB93]TDQ13153.1 hypothetical protein EDF17_1754 [Rathayibacter sp. PhB1]